ncbi:non-ribosomal peptide synthetase [Streptacidiphilus fuscans]|uniref:Amino acid adenylation domain-containing protein n=1 Tax=Streptacidiphilus fuscans TaxID=2789292 RepID=A0A931B6B6_9ACTN|nr:non-ribosomal peptide synthetase [Streptacidiphilus fuscans]MBF9069811.1 amino acid adenylation domain-containing protein [Streptacidiphilus fuscans]
MDREAEILSRLRQRGIAQETPVDMPTPTTVAATRYQESLWLLDQLDPTGLDYVVPMSWRLLGPLDVNRLRTAWDRLVQEQQALRSGLRKEGGRLLIDPARPAPVLQARTGDPAAASDTAPIDLTVSASSRATVTGAREDWRLDIDVHHAFFDDWSSTLLLPRLAELYTTPDSSPKPPAVSFTDWAEQSRRTAETREADDTAYWAKVLDGADIDHGLTCHVEGDDTAGAGRDGGRGSVSAVVPLDEPEIEALLRSVADVDAGPASVLLALWWSILFRAGGNSDLTIGTPVSQRWSHGADAAIGLCVNTVPVRPGVGVGVVPTFRSAVRACHAAMADAVEHAALPFPDIVTAAGTPRSSAKHQLFRAWFATVERSQDAAEFQGLRSTAVEAGRSGPKFEIALHALRAPKGWSLLVEADAREFTQAFVDDLVRRCAVLARLSTVEPDQPLSTFTLVPQPLTRRLRGPRTPLPHERLEQSFRAQVRRTPEQVALVKGAQQVTYAELDRASDVLAARLVEQGVTESARISIAIGRGCPQIAAVLAVLKAGCTYVALDRKNPRERTSRILDVARPELVIADSESAASLPEPWARRLLVLDDWSELAGTATAPEPVRGPEAPAYVTFTSGSTGLPKGIEMPHRAVANLVRWLGQTYEPLSPGGRLLQYASLSFDMSAEEIYSALHAGATLVLIDEDDQRDVAELARTLTEQSVQMFFMPAPALQQLARYCVDHGLGTAELTTVISEAEQLAAGETLRRWFAGAPRTRLHNQYGPSETHVSTRYSLAADPAEWPDWVPVGRPLSNVDVLLLDGFGEPVLHGASGEVYLGGSGVAHSYVRQPAGTARAFVPDPAGVVPGARLYRTGDVARLDAAGDLVFVGRRDGQVKVRGFRIETQEVRLCLNAHPGVSDSFIRTFETDEGSVELAAYLVPSGQEAPGVAELREHMVANLPEYMCPRTFNVLSELPLNVNRKVDVGRLPEPDLGALARDAAGDPPQGETEEQVAVLFAEVLGVPAVGRTDHFFGLGGSSLLATSLVWRIEEHFGIELSLRVFYTEPTVTTVAARIDLLRSESRTRREEPRSATDPAAIGSRISDILSEFR